MEGIDARGIKPAQLEPPGGPVDPSVGEYLADVVGDPPFEFSHQMDLEPEPLDPIGNYFNIISYYLVTYGYERYVTGRPREQAPLQ